MAAGWFDENMDTDAPMQEMVSVPLVWEGKRKGTWGVTADKHERIAAMGARSQ